MSCKVVKSDSKLFKSVEFDLYGQKLKKKTSQQKTPCCVEGFSSHKENSQSEYSESFRENQQ